MDFKSTGGQELRKDLEGKDSSRNEGVTTERAVEESYEKADSRATLEGGNRIRLIKESSCKMRKTSQ